MLIELHSKVGVELCHGCIERKLEPLFLNTNNIAYAEQVRNTWDNKYAITMTNGDVFFVTQADFECIEEGMNNG